MVLTLNKGIQSMTLFDVAVARVVALWGSLIFKLLIIRY